MYQKIAEKLMAAIENDDYQNKLPSEAELMKMFDVSRNTIRKALSLLVQRGYLRRIQGSGYYINHISKDKTRPVVNFSGGGSGKRLNIADQLTSKIVTFDEIKADDSIAKHLHIKKGTDLYRTFRLRYLKGELYAYEQAYYLKSEVPYLPLEAVQNSIFNFIKNEYQVVARNSENNFFLEHISKEDAAVMGLEPETACIAQRQSNFHKNNQLFNFSHTIYCYEGLSFYFYTSDIISD